MVTRNWDDELPREAIEKLTKLAFSKLGEFAKKNWLPNEYAFLDRLLLKAEVQSSQICIKPEESRYKDQAIKKINQLLTDAPVPNGYFTFQEHGGVITLNKSLVDICSSLGVSGHVLAKAFESTPVELFEDPQALLRGSKNAILKSLKNDRSFDAINLRQDLTAMNPESANAEVKDSNIVLTMKRDGFGTANAFDAIHKHLQQKFSRHQFSLQTDVSSATLTIPKSLVKTLYPTPIEDFLEGPRSALVLTPAIQTQSELAVQAETTERTEATVRAKKMLQTHLGEKGNKADLRAVMGTSMTSAELALLLNKTPVNVSLENDQHYALPFWNVDGGREGGLVKMANAVIRAAGLPCEAVYVAAAGKKTGLNLHFNDVESGAKIDEHLEVFYDVMRAACRALHRKEQAVLNQR